MWRVWRVWRVCSSSISQKHFPFQFWNGDDFCNELWRVLTLQTLQPSTHLCYDDDLKTNDTNKVMKSFVRWVMEHKEDYGYVGDLAKDMATDIGISKRWGYAQLYKHLKKMGACKEVFEILDVLRDGYEYEKDTEKEQLEIARLNGF